MRIVNKELFKTLRFRISLAFFAVFFPLMLLLIYNNIYAGKVLLDQVAQSNKNLVSLYMGQIDRSLEEANQYLYTMAAQESDLIILDRPDSYNKQDYQWARIRLFNRLSLDIANYKAMDLFFVYSNHNRDFIMGPNDAMTFEQREDARLKLMQLLENDQPNASCLQSWCIQQVNQKFFLCHLVKAGDVYIGAWVNVNRLMVPMNLIDLGETGVSVIATGSFEPTNHAAFIHEHGIDLALNDKQYKITGDSIKFMEVGERSSKGDFSLNVLIPEHGIMKNLPFFQKIASFVPFGFLVILILLLLFLRKLILRPIYRMLTAMRRFKEGNWDTQITPYPSSVEFEVMNATFNEMVSHIQRLKIDVYEEQLNHQRAELQHLQLQINPHFFLNSLNIVYHLAQSKKYELIQEMSLSLVEYFRFMFRSNLTFVSLKDEIKHTHNYLNIQKMRFPKHLTFEINVSEVLVNKEVPPLIVQTFVENTIKHSVTMDDPIHIQIEIKSETVGDAEVLRIHIHDTGKGFPEHVLVRLQASQVLNNESGENIGIWNVKRRLALLYKNRAQIEFFNAPDGGACVKIALPLYNPKS